MPRLASPHRTLRGRHRAISTCENTSIASHPAAASLRCLPRRTFIALGISGRKRACLPRCPVHSSHDANEEAPAGAAQGPRSAARSRPPPDLRARSSGRDQASVMRVVIWPEVDDGGHQGGIRPLPLAIIIDELRGVAFTRQSVMAWSPSREVVHTCVLSAHTPETGPSALSTCRGSPRSSERTCTR